MGKGYPLSFGFLVNTILKTKPNALRKINKDWKDRNKAAIKYI